MQQPYAPSIGDHALDVMAFAADAAQSQGSVALAIVTETEGGGVRAPGAMMAIAPDGTSLGYLSGGCIDQDIALRAQAVLQAGEPVTLRYGEGSPFIDIRLPCGGRIDLTIYPITDARTLSVACERLNARQPVRLRCTSRSIEPAAPDNTSSAEARVFHYRPKIKLCVAGISENPVALISLARAMGLEASIWSPDKTVLEKAELTGADAQEWLETPTTLPDAPLDADTAFILMFHDHDWEPALLKRALQSDAFYIGALGSRTTHSARCETLRARGVSDADIARIHGPIGLIPSMRDASMLAVSVMAEVVQAYQTQVTA